MKYYYYVSGIMGMTSSGSFSRDKSKWIIFNQNEIDTMGNNKPYGATKRGAFILTSKFG